MSEIDKLINQAFPDELRDIEPIDVDEDAILARTLETLGLEQPIVPELPDLPVKPLRRLTKKYGRKKEEPGQDTHPGLIEVPVVVHHRWMDLAGWAIAACLVLVCAINWGPWLIDNLDFGIGPRSSGDIADPESSQDVSSARSGQLTPENKYNTSVTLIDVSYGENTVTISLSLDNGWGSAPDLDQIDIKLEPEYERSGDVTRISRNNSDNLVVLTYNLDTVRDLILTVRQLVPLLDDSGEEVGLAYQNLERLEMNLKTGIVQSLVTNKQYTIDIYGTDANPAHR